MSKTERSSKGKFSAVDLPVAKGYLWPSARRRLLWVSILGAFVVLAVMGLDFWGRQGQLVSGGPLSSAHAFLENDCSSCHVGFAKVDNAQCSVCHEKYGDDLGSYTFAAHYLYRSGDYLRQGDPTQEVSCATCHREHGGRSAPITAVEDARCGDCHGFSTFADVGSTTRGAGDHPSFEPLQHPDPAGLEFAHGEHVLEVMAELQTVDPERACLSCHLAEADGRNFQPIDFDQTCGTCHLGGGVATPRLPTGDPSKEAAVATLEAIQQSGDAGTQWAFATNPNEFRQVGRRVSKTPVHHRDPWVLENLRRLRQRLYPEAGLADLLDASAEVSAQEIRSLYEEAVVTLEEQAKGLYSQPAKEVHVELEIIESLLAELRRELQDPRTLLDENAFLLALGEVDPNLSTEDIEEAQGLVDQLTSACTTCHALDRLTIGRVQKDQRAFRRAEFNHRAHIIERRCVDCHYAIPVPSAGEEPVDDPTLDHAGIQNLPDIEACVTCHTPKLVRSQCITCHFFHPDKEQQADLLLYAQ